MNRFLAPCGLPSGGSPRFLTLLIASGNMLGYTDPAVVDERIFGAGEPTSFPNERLIDSY